MTPCLRMWDWRVLTAGPLPSCSHNLLFFLSSLFYLFYPFVGLVLWGWGLPIEIISLTADTVLIIIIIIIILQCVMLCYA